MGAESEADTDRAVVKTYVPAYQKAEWQDRADELGMTQSEFVRTMVQAGKRGYFEAPDTDSGAPTEDENDGTDQLEERVQRVLSSDEYLSWERLLEAITADIEDQLEDTLAELQDENVVRYSGRNGGYTLVEP